MAIKEDATFSILRNFAYGGGLRREGDMLTVSAEDVRKELAKGIHPNTGRPISSLINHCEPADRFTADLCKTVLDDSKEKEAEAEAALLPKLKEEFDRIGAAYDSRWTVKKMQRELIKAKREKGR